MNGPKYFNNQIVKVQNLEFLRDTQEQNINQNFLAFTKGTGGITTGLNVTSGTGIFYNVSAGIAYDNNGERMQNYSGVSLAAISGSNVVWATMVESDYNPDYTTPPPYSSYPPYNNAQTNINPTNGSGVNVSTFNTMVISQISGVGSIPLGLVTSNGANITNVQASGLPYRQDLKLVGILDVNSSTIDGSILSLNSVDSNRFSNPLNYNIYIASGIGIFPVNSGAAYLGTASIPFAEIDTKQLNATIISGLSPINVASSLALAAASSIYSTGTNLRINPSGQDTYIGNGSYTGTPGHLFVNNITAWDNSGAPVAPIMNINAGLINLIGGGAGGGFGIQIQSAGQGTTIQGGNSINLSNVQYINETASQNIILTAGSTALVTANTVELSCPSASNVTLTPADFTINANTTHVNSTNGNIIMGNGTVNALNFTVTGNGGVTPLVSGVATIGSATVPFSQIHANTVTATNFNGFANGVISGTNAIIGGFVDITSSTTQTYNLFSGTVNAGPNGGLLDFDSIINGYMYWNGASSTSNLACYFYCNVLIDGVQAWTSGNQYAQGNGPYIASGINLSGRVMQVVSAGNHTIVLQFLAWKPSGASGTYRINLTQARGFYKIF